MSVPEQVHTPSVPQEVFELRVKVAELQNDLWHVRNQRDAAVASTQTLVQVVGNLTTPQGHTQLSTIPSQTPSTLPARTEDDSIRSPNNYNELSRKHAESEAKVNQLEEKLACSEKLRKNLQVMNRRLAGKKVDGDEQDNFIADNESDSNRESGREAKRCNRVAQKHSRVCSSSPSRGRPLVRSEIIDSRNAEVVPRVEAPRPVPAFGSLPLSILAVSTPAPTPAPLASLAVQTSGEEAEKAAAWAARKKAAVEEAERRDAAFEAEKQAAALAAAVVAEKRAAKKVLDDAAMKVKMDTLKAKRASDAKAKEDAASKSTKIPIAVTKAVEHLSTSPSGSPSLGRKVTRAEEHATKQAAADRDLAERMGGLMRQAEAKKEAAYKSAEMPTTPASIDVPPTKTPTAPASTKAVEHPSTPPLVSPPSVVELMAESKVGVLQKKRGNLIPLADFLAEVDGPVSPPMTFERVPKPVASPAPVGMINYGEGFVALTNSVASPLIPKEEVAPRPITPSAPSFSEPVAPTASSGRPIIIYLDDEGKEERINYGDGDEVESDVDDHIDNSLDRSDESHHLQLSYKNPEEIDLDLSDESGDESDTPLFHVPQPLMSDELKAIDTHATNDWEDSDDEDDVFEVAPSKPLPKTDRAIRLLGICEEPEVDLAKLVLAKFIVPEPGTVFKTGLNMAVHTDPERIMDRMKSAFGGWKTPAAFQQGPNKNLFNSEDEIFLACRHDHKQKKVCRDFFRFGLLYSPASDRRDVLRTVHIGNLPSATTIGDLTRRVRGGMIISAKILDTMKLMGSNSAIVIFVEAASAANYVKFANEHPITFGMNRTAVVTLVGTPTYPTSAETYAAMTHRRGATRCIQIAGCPQGYIDKKTLDNLVKDLCKKSILVENPTPRSKYDEHIWIKVLDGHRAASIEEPSFESETLQLSFSSVDMASSAYDILTVEPPSKPTIYGPKKTKYDNLGLTPRFVKDTCAGELSELLRLPPMEFEMMANSKPTALQNLRASIQRQVNTPAPAVVDHPVDSVMPEPQAESELTDDFSSAPEQEPASNETIEVTTAKRYPLMVTSSVYRQLFSKLASEAIPAEDLINEGSSKEPLVITGAQYDEVLYQHS